MSNATDQFTESPTLTAIAIAYSNPDHALIADQALPRVPVPTENFKYQKYDEAEMFTLPDTKVGRRSTPNQVEIEGSEENSSTQDYGIDIPLDNATIEAAKASGFDPEARATERSTNIVLLDREVRVATLLTNPASYHSDHVETLSGTDLFSDAASDPLSIIEDLMATCWQKPNQIEFGFPAWRAFRKHPKIIKAILGNSGDQGRATLAQVAELLEVKRVLVGESRVNIKRPGEAAQLQRVWGNSVCGQFIDQTADTSGGITFGITAQHKEKVAGTLPANMGLRGGKLVRSGESVKELIIAKRAGFLIQNAA
ncbi:capsid protein [Maritalea porphyrae]|uniref:capsid protein n=1 Tax=Maritalea porphyrae TaxID=880732 RepID=UPI0022AF675C|nr:capsid protein [Maritalea porphyrae]MCZ4273309.1 capsid protein [Maritalea porphyrae]